MKKFLIGLFLVFSLTLVGCNYKIHDSYSYEKGKDYLNLDHIKISNYSNKLSDEIDVLDGSKTIEKFNSNNKSKYNDFKYGMIENTINILNSLKEKGIDEILIKNTRDRIELKELIERQKEVYSDDYNRILDDYISLFNDIYKNYNGNNIDKSYKTKINSINKKYNKLIDKIVIQFSNKVNILNKSS